jgi:hypothetical protein
MGRSELCTAVFEPCFARATIWFCLESPATDGVIGDCTVRGEAGTKELTEKKTGVPCGTVFPARKLPHLENVMFSRESR